MKYDVEEIQRLARIIDVIARKCWRGLPALMGEVPQPTRQQLKDALFFRPSPDADLGIKIHGGGSLEGREIAQEDAMIDEIDSILVLFPWAELVRCVRQYMNEYPQSWQMYRRYIIASEQARSGWGKEGALARTADAFDVSDYVVRETVRSVPYEIARAVSMGYCKEEVELHG